MTNILIINPGSTAVKYTVFSNKGEELERIKFTFSKEDILKNKIFLKKIYSDGIIKIGIRIVHGGDLKGPILIDKNILDIIKKFEIFAPIHNKIALAEIKKIQKIFKDIKIYAIFDTDFHQTIPEENYIIPIDQKIAKKYRIRKYGFHGIALQSIISKLKKKNKKLPQKVIACHLGGGSSITAIKSGKSFITSMGLTPISGVMMKTRVGDIDSDADKILAKLMKKSVAYVSDMFSNYSGFLGLAGTTDTKIIFEKAQIEQKEKKGKYKIEKLAFDIYISEIIQKIYSYIGLMGGVDMITFSGGIGENNIFLQKEVIKRLKFINFKKENFLVIKIDEAVEIFEEIKKL